MIPIDPAVFLHPADYHAGGIPVLPVVMLVVGISLFAFGAWQLLEATPAERTESREDTTDSVTDR